MELGEKISDQFFISAIGFLSKNKRSTTNRTYSKQNVRNPDELPDNFANTTTPLDPFRPNALIQNHNVPSHQFN